MTIIAAVFVALFGLFVVSACVWAFFRPEWLYDFAKPMLERAWLMHLAVAIRLVLGIALLLVAEVSRFPAAFRIIGWIAIITAVALPFVGMARIKALSADRLDGNALADRSPLVDCRRSRPRRLPSDRHLRALHLSSASHWHR